MDAAMFVRSPSSNACRVNFQTTHSWITSGFPRSREHYQNKANEARWFTTNLNWMIQHTRAVNAKCVCVFFSHSHLERCTHAGSLFRLLVIWPIFPSARAGRASKIKSRLHEWFIRWPWRCACVIITLGNRYLIQPTLSARLVSQARPGNLFIASSPGRRSAEYRY
jgi:hypothetical protein